MTQSGISRRGFLQIGSAAALTVAGGGLLAACSSGDQSGSTGGQTTTSNAQTATSGAQSGATSGQSALATTQSGDTSLAGQTIEHWWWKNDPKEPVLANLAEQFKAQTGITVTIKDSVVFADYFNTLVNAIAAGTGPDSAQLNGSFFGQLIKQNVLANLNDDISGWSGQKEIVNSLWAACSSVDGKAKFGIPVTQLTYILMYRKDLLAAAGVEVPKTQEELVAAAKKLTDTSKGQYGFYIRGGYNGQDNWCAFLVAGGARIVDESGNVVLNSDVARKANDLYISTFPYSPPGSATVKSGLVLEQGLQTGTAAMIIDNIGGARSLKTPDQIDASPLPTASGDANSTVYMNSVTSNAVLASSSKKAAAFKWISFLSENTAQMAIAKSSAGYLPATTTALNDPSWADDRFFQASVAATKAGNIAWPTLPGVTEVQQKVWQPLFQGALLKQNSNDAVIEGVVTALSQK